MPSFLQLPQLIKALNESGVKLKDLDGIAVTAGPGLVGTLLLGVSNVKKAIPSIESTDKRT